MGLGLAIALKGPVLHSKVLVVWPPKCLLGGSGDTGREVAGQRASRAGLRNGPGPQNWGVGGSRSVGGPELACCVRCAVTQKLGQSIFVSGRMKMLNNLAPDTHLSITLRVSSVWGLRAASGCGQGSLQSPASLAGCCLPALQRDVRQCSLRLPAWELAGGTCCVLEGPFAGTVTAGPTDNVSVVHSMHTLGHLAEGHPKVSSLKAALFLFHYTCAFPPHRSFLLQPSLLDFRLFPFPFFSPPPCLLSFLFLSVSLLSALFAPAVYQGCHGDCQSISASRSSGPALALAMGSGSAPSCPSEGPAAPSSQG